MNAPIIALLKGIELDHGRFILAHTWKVISLVTLVLERAVLLAIAAVIVLIFLGVKSQALGVVLTVHYVDLVLERLRIVATLAPLLVPLLINVFQEGVLLALVG